MITKCKYLIISLLIILAGYQEAASQKVGLTLGGGGAKGAAEIGVLKVIEKAKVKINYISGTSIGAVIGGLYAAGYTANELDSLFKSFENDGDIGHKIEQLLKAKGVTNFADTKIPFRCVAVHIDVSSMSMNEVVLSKGKLSTAILASMSVPGIFNQVEIDGQGLYDGGLLNNLPVDVAKAMGADKIIAVDLQSGEGVDFGYSLDNVHGVLGNIINWALRRPDNNKYKTNVKSADIYIHPNLSNFRATDFGKNYSEVMMKTGANEAQKHWDNINTLK